MKNSIKMSILPLLVCLSLNGKALADSSVELPLSCNEVNYQDYIQSSAKTQKLIAETGKGCNLRGADLTGANLTGADLTGLISQGLISQGLISQGLISGMLISQGLISQGLISQMLISQGLISKRLISQGLYTMMKPCFPRALIL